MQHGRQDHDDVVGRNGVFPAERGVGERFHGESRRRRPDSQRLHEDLFDVAKSCEMLDPWCLAANDLVDHVPCFLQDVRVFEEEIGGKGQEPACRFMSCDEKRDHLKDDVLIIKLLAGHRIDAVQHAVKQVHRLFAVVRVLPPVFDHFGRKRSHDFDVRVELSTAIDHQLRNEFRSQLALSRLAEGVDHGIDKRMLVFAVEAVETTIKRTKGNRVERQSSHVIGHIDRRLRAEPLPMEKHLVGDVDHLVEHRPDTERAERLHQHTMCFGPVRFVTECRK
ncbi:hypothetical protein BLA18110_07549 [Burkholderia lata]|nr:hypothetical protein BLA18110_07549 [Burkholderia lata]